MGRLTRAHAGLVLAILVVALLPMIGAWFRWGGLPPRFGTFPPDLSGSPKPPFHWLYFGVGIACALAIVAFLWRPSLFGFRARGARQRLARGRLPVWFWLGLAVNAVSWVIHWWGPVSLARFSFIPLWWGMIIAVDGVVYARTSGRSLLATEPRRMVVIALVSMPAWAFFEFLNYYAVEFWVYPSNQIFSPTVQAIWYLLSFSVVLPGIFEWYTLLHTFDGLWNRWSRGRPRTGSTRHLGFVLAVGAVTLVLFGAYPFFFFPLLWIAPPIVLTATLVILGFWTPFRPVTQGNWSPAVLVGVSSLINGFFWEFWNYGSKFFHHGFQTNPNYWYYEIPYVDRFHLFSEMPLLGYFGYLPFGFLAWVCWLVAAHLLDYEPAFDLTQCHPADDEVLQ
jgi:hypothetical protein